MMNQLFLVIVCDIFENNKQTITINFILWVNMINQFDKGKVFIIPFSYLESGDNILKVKCINTKKEDRVLIKNVSVDYKKSSNINTKLLQWLPYGRFST